MKKYKAIIINTIVIFALMFLTHNIYSIIPNKLIGIFFPVNESIMEHMKMIYITYFIFNLLLYLFKKNKYSNYLVNAILSAIINIIIFLIIYLPIYYTFGENMIITFILLFITIFITNIISYKILTQDYDKKASIIALILSIIVMILFIITTFIPPHNPLWLDKTTNTYGFK